MHAEHTKAWELSTGVSPIYHDEYSHETRPLSQDTSEKIAKYFNTQDVLCLSCNFVHRKVCSSQSFSYVSSVERSCFLTGLVCGVSCVFEPFLLTRNCSVKVPTLYLDRNKNVKVPREGEQTGYPRKKNLTVCPLIGITHSRRKSNVPDGNRTLTLQHW